MTDKEILCRLFDLAAELLPGEPPVLRYELRTDLPPGVSVGIYAARQVRSECVEWELLEHATELARAEQHGEARVRGTLDVWAADRRLRETATAPARASDLQVSDTVELSARVYCYQPRLILGENNRQLIGPLVTMFHGDKVIEVSCAVVVPLAPAVRAAGFC